MEKASILSEIIKTRRTVFPHQFTGEKLKDDTVRQILESAVWAPTHGKTEPWFFVVLKGDSLKNFIKLKASLYKEKTPESEFSPQKAAKIAERAEQASHIIVIICKPGKNPKIPVLEEVEAVACAVQNMQLTASSMGIGSFWASGEFTGMEEMREEFGLTKKDLLLGFLYLGVPKQGLTSDAARTSIDEKSQWLS